MQWIGQKIQNNDVRQGQADKKELHGVLCSGLNQHRLILDFGQL
jgi:hypothetical protein